MLSNESTQQGREPRGRGLHSRKGSLQRLGRPPDTRTRDRRSSGREKKYGLYGLSLGPIGYHPQASFWFASALITRPPGSGTLVAPGGWRLMPIADRSSWSMISIGKYSGFAGKRYVVKRKEATFRLQRLWTARQRHAARLCSCLQGRRTEQYPAKQSAQGCRLQTPVRRGCIRREMGPTLITPPARSPTRGRHGRRLEARPPVAFAQRRAAYHGADWQRGRGLSLDHRKYRHHDPGGSDDDANDGSLRRVERAMIRERTSAGLAAARPGRAHRRATEEAR